MEDRTQTKGKSLSLHKRNLLENAAKAEALRKPIAQPNAAGTVQGTITLAPAMDTAGIRRVTPGIDAKARESPDLSSNESDVS